tara:strand:- start:3878 stop:3997 length:120 start_codon:yes stop_codon:yes gene_type:complete
MVRVYTIKTLTMTIKMDLYKQSADYNLLLCDGPTVIRKG